MANSGLRHIDVGPELTRSEWESQQTHEIMHGNAFPGGPVERQLFYRDDLHEWHIYDGAAWVSLQAAAMGVHDNTLHSPNFEEEGVAATQIETHRTTAAHTQDQPPAAHDNTRHSTNYEEQGVAATQIETHRTTAAHTQDQPPAAHDNTRHSTNYEEQGVAATQIETHRTTATHTQDQPPAAHDNTRHSTNYEEEGVAVAAVLLHEAVTDAHHARYTDAEAQAVAATGIETHRTTAAHTQDQPPAAHDNAKHSTNYEAEGVAATQIETHRTAGTHTQPQPPAAHGNAAHDPPFADIETLDRTIYADADGGSDITGDGSAGSPFQTYEKALSTVRAIIDDGVRITLHMKAAAAAYAWVATGRVCSGTGTLVIQGELAPIDSGTSTSGTPATITDTSKAWTTDQHAGKLVRVTIGGVDHYRLVESNTGNTLTVVGRYSAAPSTDAYAVLGWGTTFNGTQVCELVQGNIDVFDIARPTGTATPCFRARRVGSLSLNRCYTVGRGLSFLESPGTVYAWNCLFQGSAHYSMVIDTYQAVAFNLWLRQCWLTAGTAQVCWVGGAGSQVWFREGTIVDGQYGAGKRTGIRAEYAGFLNLFTPSVGGAVDRNVIRNCTTGLSLVEGCGARRSGSTTVDYVDNDTDRLADPDEMAWYTD